MYIVTGGAGFIGSAVVAALNDKGIKDILIVDELKDSEKWKNLRKRSYTDYLHKDQFLKNVIDGRIPGLSKKTKPLAVIHMGACSSTTETDMDFLMENNFRYTRTLARFCLDNQVRFIYASSAATYGNGSIGYSDDLNKLESLKPLNRYGYSKHLFDLWAFKNKITDLITGLKFFNVYGPNEYHKGTMLSVPFRAYHQVKEGGPIKLFKSYRPDYQDGEQQRDFVYVKDCTAVILWLLENPSVNGIFNIGTGKARTWNDLAAAVFSALELKPRVKYIDMPDSLVSQYQYFTEAEMDKLSAAGCPVKFHSLEDGIKDYVCNYLDTEDAYL